MINFTNEDILLYINNNLPADKVTAFENALINDWVLREKYEIFANEQFAFNKQVELLSPSQRTIDNIMNYATQNVPTKMVQA